MAQNRQYISVDSVIQDYLNESEQSQNKYFKCFHLAFRGFENLGLDFFYKVQSVKLPVNSNLTVSLPSDYLNWTKVGVLNDRGEIIPLYYNSRLTTYADLNPERLTKTQDDTLIDTSNWGLTTWANYWTGTSYTNIYGVPSGAPFVGNFKIDSDAGVLVLNETFAYDYIILEYVASPTETQEYYLPVQFRDALIAWLWWKDKKAISINRGQVGISRDLKNDFYNERKNAIARYKPVRQQEIYEASQQQTRLAVKS